MVTFGLETTFVLPFVSRKFIIPSRLKFKFAAMFNVRPKPSLKLLPLFVQLALEPVLEPWLPIYELNPSSNLLQSTPCLYSLFRSTAMIETSMMTCFLSLLCISAIYFSTRFSCDGVAVTVISPAFWFMIGSGAVMCSLLLFKIAFSSASSFSQKSNFSVVLIKLFSFFISFELVSLLELLPTSDGEASTEAFVMAVPSRIEVI